MGMLSLQSWLVQSERRMHLRCPEGLVVAQDEYLSTLKETANELQLPLEFETVNVNWKDANLHQTRIQVKLQSKERYGILTGLDYIGRVAFVEQKTYLDPLETPNLENVDTSSALVVGGGIALLGLIMSFVGFDSSGGLACFGMLAIIIGFFVGSKMYKEAKAEPAKKLEAAINAWVDDTVNLARRAEISNELNNTAQALDEAVKLAVDRLFTQKGAEMEADERKRKTATDIHNEVNLRKTEFK